MTVEYRCDPIEQAAINASRITVTSIINNFPIEARGGSDKSDMAPQPLTLWWRSISVETDLPSFEKSDQPRGFIRSRSIARRFYADSGAKAGDVVVFEKLGSHEYRLHLEKSNGRRVS